MGVPESRSGALSESPQAVAACARRSGVPIIEDDAYGFIPLKGPPPFAAIAPDLTWHIAGLAKCIGAGLRTAYTVVPDTRSGWPFAAALRAATVMASPFTAAIATRWIEDGTADTILTFIRAETAARQALATTILPAGRCSFVARRSSSPSASSTCCCSWLGIPGRSSDETS